jgi:hypothetical protein
VKEMGLQLVAKAQAVVEMGEIYRQQVQTRLDEGEWDSCRGLPREQQREVLAQIYCEELVAKMQQDVFNQTLANWQEHRLRRIELVQWSKLSDSEKKKWLEFYNQPSPNLNLSEGEYHADQTQKHPDAHNPQTQARQETSESEPESHPETARQN